MRLRLELERIALQDEYFVKRKLYPNVDFYSGIIYQALGFKPEMFTVLFAIPRTVGWLAQWEEMLQDPEQKIARPRQIYTGHECAGLGPHGKTSRASPPPLRELQRWDQVAVAHRAAVAGASAPRANAERLHNK